MSFEKLSITLSNGEHRNIEKGIVETEERLVKEYHPSSDINREILKRVYPFENIIEISYI